MFQGEDYLGVDMLEGRRVDKVVDFTHPFEEVDAAVEGRRFGTIICMSVLEHCDQPFLMAENITRLLVPGGSLVVSVPFVFKFHGFPSDYWRFTPEGEVTQLDIDVQKGISLRIFNGYAYWSDRGWWIDDGNNQILKAPITPDGLGTPEIVFDDPEWSGSFLLGAGALEIDIEGNLYAISLQ